MEYFELFQSFLVDPEQYSRVLEWHPSHNSLATEEAVTFSIMHGRKSKTFHRSAELRKKTFSMQYWFLETTPCSTNLVLKEEDLFNAIKIEERRPFQWCRHRRQRRWEKGRETGDGESKSTSIKSIANLLNIEVCRFHEHWYIRSIYWLWLLLCHTFW